MYTRRLPLFFLSLLLALIVLAMVRGRGLAQTASPLDVMGVGLPAVEEGPLTGSVRMAGRAAALRQALRGSSTDIVRPDGTRIARGRVIVKFRDGVSAESRRAAVAETLTAASLADRSSDADFDIVRLDPADDPEAAARRFAQRDDVRYAQPAHRVYPQFVPNDPLYGRLQWNFPLINLEKAWDIQPQAGSLITVAVIDTGIAYMNATITATVPAFVADGVRYPALGSVTIPYSAAPQLGPASRFVAPRDFVCGGTAALDFDGHGTHVSGTIGQLTNDNVGTAGVAFNVRLMPIKVLASLWDVAFGCASDTGGFDDDVARGVRYAVDNGAKVINLSLGGPGPERSSPVMEDAIGYAVAHGAFVAIAAGNDFLDRDPTEQPAEIAQRVQGAVSVAAIDPTKSHACFSSSGRWVELAAPGGSAALGDSRCRNFGDTGYVWQQTFDFSFTDPSDPSYGPYRAPRFDVLAYIGYIGTSMASPHVAGVAAMLMQQGITDPAAIEAALEQSAIDLGDPGRDSLYGFGLIDARNALRGLGLAR